MKFFCELKLLSKQLLQNMFAFSTTSTIQELRKGANRQQTNSDFTSKIERRSNTMFFHFYHVNLKSSGSIKVNIQHSCIGQQRIFLIFYKKYNTVLVSVMQITKLPKINVKGANSTLKRCGKTMLSFSRQFNVEYTWCVCRVLCSFNFIT